MVVVTASEMARLDGETIEGVGIPGIVLMENAARGAAAFYEQVVPDLLRKRIVVVAGSGNNGGDGFVLARLFHTRGAHVRVACLCPPDRLRGDALVNYGIMEKLGVPVVARDPDGSPESLLQCIGTGEAIIDAVLGTGLNSEVRGVYARVVEEINRLPVPVLAVDIPSGLNASTGKPMGCAVRATATATFGLPKIGQLVPPGEEYTGKLKVVDIGIPPSVVEQSGIRRWWMDEALVSRWVEPRPAAAHKGVAGHLAVLAGSRGKTGAAALVCEGGMRAGAGLVSLLIPSSLNPVMEVKLTEAMTVPVEETPQQTPSLRALDDILQFLEGKQALAMGPGIATHEETKDLVRQLVRRSPCPMVLDADALNALADRPETLLETSRPLVLTPHPGEMSRLVKTSSGDIQGRRLEIAESFSRRYGVVLVLKGHRTVVAAPDGSVAINSTGNPAMASGGMGDILTGLIAAWMAQGATPFQGACLGVYLHGAAADAACKGMGTRGLVASDLLREIPGTVARLESIGGGSP